MTGSEIGLRTREDYSRSWRNIDIQTIQPGTICNVLALLEKPIDGFEAVQLLASVQYRHRRVISGLHNIAFRQLDSDLHPIGRFSGLFDRYGEWRHQSADMFQLSGVSLETGHIMPYEGYVATEPSAIGLLPQALGMTVLHFES